MYKCNMPSGVVMAEIQTMRDYVYRYEYADAKAQGMSHEQARTHATFEADRAMKDHEETISVS